MTSSSNAPELTTTRLVVRAVVPGVALAAALCFTALLVSPPLRDGVDGLVLDRLMWLGAGAGCLIGAVAVWLVASASRRPLVPGVSPSMAVHSAALSTFLLKLVGAGAVLGGGFLSGLKFPQLATLGIAYAAAAVTVQVFGCVIVARVLSARSDSRRRRLVSGS